MFIKTSIRKKPSGQTYKTHYLVEGYRDKNTGKPKHRYISNLSALPDNCILALQTALKKEKLDIETIDLSLLEILCNKEYGSIKLFQNLYKKYFGKYFSNTNYNKALEAIVINKIFDPKSKNAIKNWISKVDLGYDIKDKNHLYDCLDYLKSQQDTIEKRLSKNIKEQGCSILLYDITSTYFEGKGDKDICKYGYSRDHRSDRVQVNIGLITSADGTPISVEIIPGNISDKQTLQDQISKIKQKFGIKEITFVFDRGMKSTVNLDYLQKSGYEYITALSHSELRKKCLENEEIDRNLFDKNNLSEFEIEGKYYSLVHNILKADSDKFNRNALITKTTEKLVSIQNFKRDYTELALQDKVSKVINKYKCAKFINYEIKKIAKKDKAGKTKYYGKLEYKLASKKILEAEKYDGFFMVESTNKKITGNESVSQYKDLQLVERAFDAVKNHIEIRPVFHFKERRIKGHIFSCFMSYFLLHKFKQECADLLQIYSLDDLLSELTKIQKNYIKIKNYCFTKITNLSELGEDLLKRFKVPLLCTE